MKPEDKIVQPQDLVDQVQSLPRPLVMTNGVFDVLHRGHVSYLQQAAKLGASLLVAVNSDSSARTLKKGPGRPLNSGADRAYVVAGLQSVDAVTVFDQPTPVNLVKTIAPDFYVKGGDYDMETLEETRIVRRLGGQSVSIPFVEGFSSSALIQRIRQAPPEGLRKAAFLDRDGVINKDKAYVCSWEDFEFIPGAVEGMRCLQQAGYALVIVTNQSGLARGYFSATQYRDLTKALHRELNLQGVQVEHVYHCPHHPQGTVPELSIPCDCRKPAPGLLLKAACDLGLSLPDSLLIGDKASDIEAARNAGVGRAYLVRSENPESIIDHPMANGHFSSLLACARHLSRPALQDT